MMRCFHGLLIAALLCVSGAVEALENKAQGIFKPDQRLAYKSVPAKPGQAAQLKLHIFRPENFDPKQPRPGIVFFFGGGWRGGSPSQFYHHARYLASRGMVAICAEYRTQNSHGTTPVQCVEDGKSALRYVRAHAKELGLQPDRIAAGGGSAGGHVAAATAMAVGFDTPGESPETSCMPNALVLFNPVFDNGPEGYAHDRVKDHFPQISPIHNIRADLPPAIVFLGDQDQLIPVSAAEKFKSKMEEAGNRCDVKIYPEQGHGFFNWGRDKTTDKSIFRNTLRQADVFLASLGWLTGPPTINPWYTAAEKDFR
jgi:acetyl esterase